MARRALSALFASLLLAGTACSALASDKAGESRCKRPIKLPGQPHAIKSIAEINAISNWTAAANKHGEPYAQWLYAKGKGMECAKIGQAGMFLCHAGGKPCLPPEDVQSQSQKASTAGS